MHSDSTLGKVAGLFVVIGALNWGIVGIGGFMNKDWNVVTMLLGNWPQVEWVVYILIGLSGLCAIKECMKS